jgi:hypothetical protein
VFTALTAFAEAFGNPLAPVLVLCLALLLTNPWHLRSAAAALGCLSALPELTFAPSVTAVALGLFGAIIALVLYAEVMLHLVLPCLRFAWRCTQALWALTGLVAKALLTAPPASTTSSRLEPPDENQ